MLFFLTIEDKYILRFRPFEESANFDSRVVCYLSAPLPLAIIQWAAEQLTRGQARDFCGENLEVMKKRISKVLNEYSSGLDLKWKVPERYSSAEDSMTLGKEVGNGNETWHAINQLVSGKQLSVRDLRALAKDFSLKDREIIDLVHNNVLQGTAQWVPSVKRNSKGWQCQRCGEKDVEEWPSFYGLAATCGSCGSIGPSTSLDVLYRDQRLLLNTSAKVRFQPRWSLTEAQNIASEQVAEFIGGTSDKALLWAACGAGKTEVCFPSAAGALEQGKSVLFAAPRQDVIYDIAPRFQRDFPDYPVQVLSGNTSNRFQVGNMVLATTHQVLRFWQCFDIIFLDEMDAFPYRGNRALDWGLNHALRPGGKFLYLTATPSTEALESVRKGEMLLIRLPARHHRKPLPVPIWAKYSGSFERNECTSFLIERLELLRRSGPLLIFVPKISWVAPWIKSLKKQFPYWSVEGSYSSDSERGPKLKNLKNGQYDIFVSTTILERGITLPGIQVVVFGADHPVFDERALVQMAGRVGRSAEYPDGEAVFVSKNMTPAIKTAVSWIKEQNKLALKLRLIQL
ncbi:helicase-related protein [Desulfosporosinus meridiei]|uniref:Superfamily II DNA/RNA helicase required for DNA uptake (Late competence protein) n=1 Tax=Desulfosporosinus meridiei (strain ATCC BAA-275 / DSM 13257 / KCTC 12902 / NCIMB 13706 / S10) TaxID=768704 RepID=J7IX88_DESMD|nr:helicase-related protein [Desulfosporosinus meridiei]AFQ46345.1 superfamily II DNA/RNA helicase required for DNA uptake (late competence protein) [Desulfosporosinus meridiei DSM 13257]